MSAEAAPASGDGLRLSRPVSMLLLAPFLALLLIALLLPLGTLVHESLFVPAPTLKNYARVFDDPVYLRVLWRTIRISAIVTVGTLVLAYPLALVMTRSKGLVLALLVAFVMLPLWTSVLVRTYAWTIILQRNGILNQALLWLGFTDQPLGLLYSEGAVAVAMTHVLLPFMVLPIWASLRSIPPDFTRAAYVLGASPLRAFYEIVWPLSRPGAASGSLMVFLLSMGFFVTPALIGGPKQMMIATLVSQQVRELLNWPFAGALVGCLLVLTLALVLAFNRVLGLDRFVGSR